MSKPDTPSCATTYHETSEVLHSIDPYSPYQALFLCDNDTMCSGTASYHLNHRQRKLEIGFTEDQTSQVSELSGNTNDHGMLRVAGGAMWLYGDLLPETAFPSQGGAGTAQSPTVDASNQGNKTRKGGDNPTVDPGGDGHPVGGEQEEGTVKGDTVKGKSRLE
jgi:hypothetical protein